MDSLLIDTTKKYSYILSITVNFAMHKIAWYDGEGCVVINKYYFIEIHSGKIIQETMTK